MKRFSIVLIAALCATYCTSEVVETTETVSAIDGYGSSVQGTKLDAIQLMGPHEGKTMLGFQYADATLDGVALTNLRVEKGDLYAERNQVTLHGVALKNAYLYAQVKNNANPPVITTVEYKLADVQIETGYDPTGTGGTYLYRIEQNVSGTFTAACPVDADGRRVAIPVAATWNTQGARVESPTLFTMSCTMGVIGKCYRWGYKPWLTGYGDLVSQHWACTRMARADYCGNGEPRTRDGTKIGMWDDLPPPGPINEKGQTPLLMMFEAGWNTSGAVCLSHTRWVLGGLLLIAARCPGKLIPLGLLGAHVCNQLSDVLGFDPNAHLFNESNLNLNLDLFGL